MAEQKVEYPVYDPNSGRCKVCGGETLWGDAPHADGCAFARVVIGQDVMRLKITYVCAHCGGFAEGPFFSVEILDGGTVLACDKCGEHTVVDLSTPDERAKRYRLGQVIAVRNQTGGQCLLCGAVDLNKHYERCPLGVKEVGNG